MDLLAAILIQLTILVFEYLYLKPKVENPSRKSQSSIIILSVAVWVGYFFLSSNAPLKSLSQYFQVLIAPQTHTIIIKGNDIQGVRWIVPENGNYIIRYRDGAYSGWPNESDACPQHGCWKTAVFAYVGCQPDFERVTSNSGTYEQLTNPSFIIGYKTPLMENEAIRASKRQLGLQMELEKNQCLLFTADDGRDRDASWDAYSDNRGEVVINLYLILTSQ